MKANSIDLWRKSAMVGVVLSAIGPFSFFQGWALEAIETPDGLVLQKTVGPEERTQALGKESARDPFNWSQILMERYKKKSQPAEDSVFKEFQLLGILWDNKMPLAIIDDQVLHEGDMIKGVTVRTISRNEVLLLHENKSYTLRFSALFELESNREKAGSK
jgi:hypothetical protein